MKKILYIGILAAGFIVFFSLFSGETDEDYQKRIAEQRKERIDFLKNSDQSPFKKADQKIARFDYFPINKSYRVQARLERIKSIQRVRLNNSDGSVSNYTKFAFARFSLNNQELKLLILKPSGFGVPNTYFTGFADETSGDQTYGGGRYLDLEIGKSDKVEIDFNLAYNPYCAYISGYTCPLPPTENILPVAIPAGEKDYPH